MAPKPRTTNRPQAERGNTRDARQTESSRSQQQPSTARAQSQQGAARTRARRTQRGTQADAQGERAWWAPTLPKAVALIVLLAVVLFGARLCSSASAIDVTVNGSHYSLRGEKTLQVALKESGLPVNPGDLISLGGAILQRGAGHPFYATVNGEETVDPEYKLRGGDDVTITDGKDIVEPYDAVESPAPFEASIVGMGPIHTFTPGQDGVMETRTGQISGEVVEKQTVEPTDLVETRAAADIGERKVIALTFDDGPSSDYTADILDVLAANDAKATFFCLGESLDTEDPDLVKREVEEGHQVCTHSYDNALVGGGEMAQLTDDQLVEQLEQGLRAVEEATGAPASKCVRLGSKDLDEACLPTIAPLIDAEIGWTLDTGDWVNMDETQIYDVLMSAQAGDVIRMHDGGGYQDTTVSALKKALPKLAAKGFSFVTIDELRGTAQTGQ